MSYLRIIKFIKNIHCCNFLHLFYSSQYTVNGVDGAAMEDAANNAEVVSQRRNDNATVPNLNSVEDPAKVLHLINNPVTLKDVEVHTFFF